MKRLVQRSLVYYIPLLADCKFRNRLHLESDIEVTNESIWNYKNSHNVRHRSEVKLQQAAKLIDFDVFFFQGKATWKRQHHPKAEINAE